MIKDIIIYETQKSTGLKRERRAGDWLAHKLRPMFEQRVSPVSEDVMFKWRPPVEEGRKVGHRFSQPDPVVAATALHRGLTVVSRDVSDYRKARTTLAFRPQRPNCWA